MVARCHLWPPVLALQMSRLIILLGPVASALAGAALGFVGDQLVLYAVYAILNKLFGAKPTDDAIEEDAGDAKAEVAAVENKKKTKGKKGEKGEKEDAPASPPSRGPSTAEKAKKSFFGVYNSIPVAILRIGVFFFLLHHFKAVSGMPTCTIISFRASSRIVASGTVTPTPLNPRARQG